MRVVQMATPSTRKAARVLILVGIVGLSLLFASLASDALMLDFVYLFPLSDSLFLAGVVTMSLSVAGGFAFQIIQRRRKEANDE